MPEDDTTPRIGEFVGVDDDGYVVRWNSRLRLGDSVSIGTMVTFSGSSEAIINDGRNVFHMPLRFVAITPETEQQTPKKTLWQHLRTSDAGNEDP